MTRVRENFLQQDTEKNPTNYTGKDEQIELLKLRDFCSSNDTIKQMKR